MDSTSLWIAGVIAGAAHVALAPDHVMALLVFSADARRRAWRVGLWWGAGHAGAIALVALVLLQVRERLRLDFLTEYGEYVAGGMLIAIGLWGLYDARNGAAPQADHGHSSAKPGSAPDPHLHTRLAVVAGFAGGLVHSLAGNGLLLATLPALGLSVAGAHSFLLAFSVSTVVAAIALTALLGGLASLPADRSRAYRSLVQIAGVSSVVLGVIWLVLVWAGVELHPELAGRSL